MDTINRVFIVLLNTLKQGLRRRFIFIIALLSVFVLFLSLALGELSLGENLRLTVNFGLASVEISLALMSVLFGAVFISGDLERKTLLTLLIRPISPGVFFFSRWLGLSLLIFLALLVLSLILAGFFIYQGLALEWNFIQTLLGFYFQSLLLLAFVLLFSSYSSSFFVLFYSLSLFVIGHGTDAINYLFRKEAGFISSFLPLLIPDLNRVNWKSAVIYGDKISFQEFFFSSVYIFSWLGFVLFLALYFFEKREYS